MGEISQVFYDVSPIVWADLLVNIV